MSDDGPEELAFLVLEEGQPATVRFLGDHNETFWLVVNAGAKFVAQAQVGDFVHVRYHASPDQIIVRLGKEYPRPLDPRAEIELWKQLREGKEPTK